MSVLDELTSQRIETLKATTGIIKGKKLKIFTIPELAKCFPYMKYMTLYMRLIRLSHKRMIEDIAKGVYMLTPKGEAAIAKLEKLTGMINNFI